MGNKIVITKPPNQMAVFLYSPFIRSYSFSVNSYAIEPLTSNSAELVYVELYQWAKDNAFLWNDWFPNLWQDLQRHKRFLGSQRKIVISFGIIWAVSQKPLLPHLWQVLLCLLRIYLLKMRSKDRLAFGKLNFFVFIITNICFRLSIHCSKHIL